MKARLHPTPAMQKAIDAYAESKIQGIQSRAQEAVMKERNDIATRATYLCLLACYQVGLSPLFPCFSNCAADGIRSSDSCGTRRQGPSRTYGLLPARK